jgi:hypothetical protein
MTQRILEALHATDVADELPTDLFDLPDETIITARGTVAVEIGLLPDGSTSRIHVHLSDSLLTMMRQGAAALGMSLLPPATDVRPLDLLRWLERNGSYSPAISDLDQALWTFLRAPRGPRRFGIELVRAFSVNTKWAVGLPTMSPREILALPQINLPFQEYSLYRPGSSRELPLDEQMSITRRDHFEAVRDGKYGSPDGNRR